MTSPFPCSPVIRKCSRKKTQSEKQTHILCYLHLQLWPSRWSRIQKQSPKMFQEILQISQENTCVWFFFTTLQAFRPATLLKKKLLRRCFPVKFEKFLRTTILKNICEWLLQCNDSWHGVKVGPGLRDPGPRDSRHPSKFKSGTRDPFEL